MSRHLGAAGWGVFICSCPDLHPTDKAGHTRRACEGIAVWGRWLEGEGVGLCPRPALDPSPKPSSTPNFKTRDFWGDDGAEAAPRPSVSPHAVRVTEGESRDGTGLCCVVGGAAAQGVQWTRYPEYHLGLAPLCFPPPWPDPRGPHGPEHLASRTQRCPVFFRALGHAQLQAAGFPAQSWGGMWRLAGGASGDSGQGLGTALEGATARQGQVIDPSFSPQLLAVAGHRCHLGFRGPRPAGHCGRCSWTMGLGREGGRAIWSMGSSGRGWCPGALR